MTKNITKICRLLTGLYSAYASYICRIWQKKYTWSYMVIQSIYMVYTMFICVWTWIYLYIQLSCVQDTIFVIPPYPFCIEESMRRFPTMFRCKNVGNLLCSFFLPATCDQRVRDLQRMHPTNADIRHHLAFLSTFEKLNLNLPIDRPMEHAGVTKF